MFDIKYIKLYSLLTVIPLHVLNYINNFYPIFFCWCLVVTWEYSPSGPLQLLQGRLQALHPCHSLLPEHSTLSQYIRCIGIVGGGPGWAGEENERILGEAGVNQVFGIISYSVAPVIQQSVE